METITCKILDSISLIPRKDWDDIFGDIPEGYMFFKTLEESKLSEFSFYYLVLYQDRSPLLIAPLFTGDFPLDIVIEGPLNKVIQCLRKVFPRFLIMKTLFCGSPFGERGIMGIKKDAPDEKALLRTVTTALEEFGRENKIPLTMFKDFPESDIRLLRELTKAGFFQLESFPSVIIEIGVNSIEEYFQSLSYATRKNLRRKIKKAHAQGEVKIEIRDSVEDILEEVYGLYLNTYSAGRIRFEKLTREFFLRTACNLAPQAKFVLYYAEGRLAAFNLCFQYRDLLIDKFIGFDYETARKYNLYFLSWCFNVEHCIKESIRYYQTGQTDYEPKIKLGGKLIPLFVYLKHRNLLLTFVFRQLSKIVATRTKVRDALP